MEWEEVATRLNNYFAYDTGSLCSGVHDPAGKSQAISWVRTLSENNRRIFLALLVRDLLTDEAIAEGYGAEDAKELMSWLEDHSLI